MVSFPRLLIGFYTFWFSISLVGNSQAEPAEELAAGKQAYMESCARCHGDTGAGNGRDAARMSPLPRPLADGVFKFRTTASGTPPTDEDLYRTISEGLPGSRMPEFQRLPEETRWQLVQYIKTLAPIFQEQKPEPLDLGRDPGPAKANLERGQELYTKLGCNACHGPVGRGDGLSAPTLVDQWSKPIRAANLTQGWRFRGGPSPRDILTRLMTGLDGTPMPSYAEAVSSAAEVWDLAYYVHSLQVQPEWKRSLQAVRYAAPLPGTPEDPVWTSAPRTDVKLSNLLYKEGAVQPAAVHAISAQAVYNDSEIVFRFAWHDPSENKETPPDAIGFAFLADRKSKWKAGPLRSWPPAGAEALLDAVYWSAAGAQAREAVSKEPGEMARKEPAAALQAMAAYAAGEWSLVVRRPLVAPVDGAVTLAPGQTPTLFGVMVWDGGNGEEGRHRAGSSWLDLKMEAPHEGG